MDFKVGGMIMIIPTIAVAFYLTWKSRKDLSELFHNLAVSCWILANGVWMIGEFFYDDGTRPIAITFFMLGLIAIATYYLYIKKFHVQNEALKNQEKA